MKKICKTFSVLLVAVIALFSFSVTAGAVEETKNSQDGLVASITSEKNSYNANEDIELTFKVTNTNDFAVENVSLKAIIPDGLTIKSKADTSIDTVSLNSGESLELTLTAVKENLVTSTPTDNTSVVSNISNNNGNDSDKTVIDTGNTGSYLILGLICLACLIVGVLVFRFKKKTVKYLSIVLFVCISVGSIAVAGIPNASAKETKQEKSFEVSKTIMMDSDKYNINAIVKYATDEKHNTDDILSIVQKYCGNNAKLIDVIDAENSSAIPTEAEVINILEKRGFNDYPITYQDSINGEYVGEREASKSSTDKHPMYQTFFVSENEELWTIFVINGQIIANPVVYNLEYTEIQFLISESEQITSYDSELNKFYVTIPDKSMIIVKNVERINAETLNKLISKEIENL